MLRRPQIPKPIRTWKGPKPKLRMSVTHQYRVHYLDLQAYLAEVYQTQGDILKITRLTHGIFPEYLVTGRMPPISNLGQQTDDIRRGRRIRSLDLVLNMLCEDGFIPKGKYVIDTTAPLTLIERYTDLLNQHQDPNHPECVAFRKRHDDPKFKRQLVRYHES